MSSTKFQAERGYEKSGPCFNSLPPLAPFALGEKSLHKRSVSFPPEEAAFCTQAGRQEREKIFSTAILPSSGKCQRQPSAEKEREKSLQHAWNLKVAKSVSFVASFMLSDVRYRVSPPAVFFLPSYTLITGLPREKLEVGITRAYNKQSPNFHYVRNRPSPSPRACIPAATFFVINIPSPVFVRACTGTLTVLPKNSRP